MRIYDKLIEKYGKEKQLIMVIEELAELQQAITKILRGNENLDNLKEEIADVEIMIDQLKSFMKLNEFEIDIIKLKKLKRIEGLLDE